MEKIVFVIIIAAVILVITALVLYFLNKRKDKYEVVNTTEEDVELSTPNIDVKIVGKIDLSKFDNKKTIYEPFTLKGIHMSRGTTGMQKLRGAKGKLIGSLADSWLQQNQEFDIPRLRKNYTIEITFVPKSK